MIFFSALLSISAVAFGGLLYFFTFMPVEAGLLQQTFPETAAYLKSFINLYVPLLVAAASGIGGGGARYLFDRRKGTKPNPAQALDGAVYAFFGFALIVGGASISFVGMTGGINMPAAISYGALFGFLGRNLLSLFDLSTPESVSR